MEKVGGNALQYLEEKFPDRRPLLPKDPLQRAHIHQVFKFPSLFCDMLSSNHESLHVLSSRDLTEQICWIGQAVYLIAANIQPAQNLRILVCK
jgi:glutathione S-transferase